MTTITRLHNHDRTVPLSPKARKGAKRFYTRPDPTIRLRPGETMADRRRRLKRQRAMRALRMMAVVFSRAVVDRPNASLSELLDESLRVLERVL